MVFAFENGTIDETIDFDKVSFNGNSSNESKNIQEYEETNYKSSTFNGH